VGYIGAFVYFLIFYLILRKSLYYFKIEEEPYWRAFDLGMIGFSFIMIIIGLFYVPVFIDDAISAFYFSLAGFIIIRSDRYK